MVSIRASFKSKAAPDAPIYIYGLVDPRTDLIRYVGVADDPENRLIRHLYQRKADKTYKNRWLSKLWEKGLRPTIRIIDIVDPTCEDWETIERFYIAAYRAVGFSLTNASAGGSGTRGYVPTPTARQRHSIATAKWAERHPDRVIRGEQHWSKLFPDRVARGDRNGARTHPEKRPRGERHGARTHPESRPRGERNRWYGITGDAHPCGGDKNWQRQHPERVRHGEQINGAILTQQKADEIRLRYAGRIKGKKNTAPMLAKEYGVAENTIYRIIRGETWLAR
jgi:hypothetical protein